MSSLKEMIRERKITEALREAPSEAGGAPKRTLQVHAWNGQKWVLPWGYFYSAHLKETANHEQLVLRIAHHEVVLVGVRLSLLLPEIPYLTPRELWVIESRVGRIP